MCISHLSSSLRSSKILLMLLMMLCFIFPACDDSDDTPVVQTELPQNTNATSSLNEASQESGLSGIEICRELATHLGEFFFSEQGTEFTCGFSAFSASFATPDPEEICDSIYNNCRNNYSAQTICSAQSVAQISACPVSIGLWRDCIDEQTNFFYAMSAVRLDCMDLTSYNQALETNLIRHPLTSCKEIERICPEFSTSSN